MNRTPPEQASLSVKSDERLCAAANAHESLRSCILALQFLGSHHCQPSCALKIREGDYVCDVRVNGKNLSFDYRGDGATPAGAVLNALLIAEESWPESQKSGKNEEGSEVLVGQTASHDGRNGNPKSLTSSREGEKNKQN